LEESGGENFIAWIVEMVVEKRVGADYLDLERPIASRLSFKIGESQYTALSELLSVLARFSHANEQSAIIAFEHGAISIGLPLEYQGGGKTLKEMRASLGLLSNTSLNFKENIISACMDIISEDDQVKEGELVAFRAICECLELPVSLLPLEVADSVYQRENLV